MSNITIFTAPKAFSDPHINIIQRNAIQSWKDLGPRAEVFLIGDEEGMKEVAANLDVRQLPDVKRNEMGTPLVSSIFSLAREAASHEVMVYTNADIMLLPEVFQVIDAIRGLEKDFLLVGRRWGLDIKNEIDFSTNWQADIERKLTESGKFDSMTAMDYFIFPSHLFRQIPPFAIGRAGWDNWMIYHAVQQAWPIIDITPSHRVVHQNHGYGHLPNGVIHYDLEESYQNVVLAGGMRSTYDLLDVPLIFQDGRIQRKRITLSRILRKLERIVMPVEQKGWRWEMTRLLRKTRRKIA
ncbi:MAG: hypothetical protein DRI65_07820 [Chloroflexota bacterium]|nr:MAG: hypothetical protein DRI65_07820 [Chloroflexota bacterium]